MAAPSSSRGTGARGGRDSGARRRDNHGPDRRAAACWQTWGGRPPLESAGRFGADFWPAGRVGPWIPLARRPCRTKAKMVGSANDIPAGDGERKGRTEEEADRRGRAVKAARVRAMIARGEVPFGCRINDEGTGFVRIGNPAWPVRPFERHCSQYGEPSLELLVLIRNFLPDFDPESDRRGWLDVAEIVRRAGRTAAEIETMGHDELVAFFRYEVFARLRLSAEVEQTSTAAAKPAPTAATVTPGVATKDDTTSDKTTSELLLEWLGDPERKPKLVATLSAQRAGEIIGRAESTVRGAGDAWDELKAEFKAFRAYRRYERKRRRQ